MDDKSRRKELVSEYKRTRPEAGVYRIVNTRTGKVLLGSSPNLTSVRSKLAFARSTNSPGVFGHRLREDIGAFGVEAFDLEVLDVLETKPEMTAAEVRAELATLEALWREKQVPALLY